MPELPRLLAANQRFAETFTKGELAAPPTRRLAILTCMDARLVPHEILGLTIGEAHVIRNAGGRASDDALRSLILSYKLLGTREFLVIHHTDCGLEGLENEGVRETLERDTGADASGLDFLGFPDLEESVREDVRILRDSPHIPDEISVSGYVYDIETGLLRAVVPPDSP